MKKQLIGCGIPTMRFCGVVMIKKFSSKLLCFFFVFLFADASIVQGAIIQNKEYFSFGRIELGGTTGSLPLWDLNQTVSRDWILPGFDGSLGTLTAVSISYEYTRSMNAGLYTVAHDFELQANDPFYIESFNEFTHEVAIRYMPVSGLPGATDSSKEWNSFSRLKEFQNGDAGPFHYEDLVSTATQPIIADFDDYRTYSASLDLSFLPLFQFYGDFYLDVSNTLTLSSFVTTDLDEPDLYLGTIPSVYNITQGFVNVSYEYTPQQPVPEPTTMLLFGSGLVGLVGSRIRTKKK